MKLLRLIAAGLLLAPLLPRPAAAQAPDPTFTPPTGLYSPGIVYALGPQQADGKRVVAGTFSRVNGSPLSGLVRLDASGAVDQAFSQAVGTASNAFRVRSLPSGQYLLGAYGGYVTAGGVSRSELLRLNTNGTADTSFDPGSGPSGGGGYVQEFEAQPDGKIVVTGTFSSFNNVPAAGVARLNANGSVDTGFNVGSGFDANASNAFNAGYAVVVQADGKIVVGGEFETFNGQTVNGLVRLTATGSVDPTFTPSLQSGSFIESLLVQPDGKLLACGSIYVSPNNSLGVVRFLPSGVLDPTFNAPAFLNGGVSTGQLDRPMVLQPDGKLLVVGYFQQAGANYVARLNTNGSLDQSFAVSAGPNTAPYTIGLNANGTVLLGGSFNLLNGIETPLGRLTSSGSADVTFTPKLQVPGSVAAVMQQTDGKLVIGGNFTEINGQPVHRLARLSAAGALELGYTASTGTLPGPVSCLALQPDGKVLAGTTGRVVRFQTSGAPDASFNLSNAVSPTCLALQTDGKVLVGGNFTINSGGTQYAGLARFSTFGTLDPTFVRPTGTASATGAPVFTDAVLVQPDGRIVAAGLFRVPTGGAIGYLGRVARYEPTGALDPSFTLPGFTNTAGTANTTNRLYALAQQPDGKLLVGGNFGAVDGTLHYGVARLTTTGAPDSGFNPDALLTGTVFSLALQPNGRVLVGGTFTNSGASVTTTNLARLLANGASDVSFTNSAAPNASVRSVLVQPDGRLVLAGAFTTVGGTPAAGVARISAANVLQVAAPAAVAARTAAWPVPVHGLLHVASDANAQPLSVELLDALGRSVRHVAATGAAEVTLDATQLPAGVYVLRVRYAAGAVTRRLTVE